MGIIYVLNLLLGEGANFWYLLKKPEAGSIMDVFPEPPFHLLITTPIGIVLVLSNLFTALDQRSPG